MTEQWDGG